MSLEAYERLLSGEPVDVDDVRAEVRGLDAAYTALLNELYLALTTLQMEAECSRNTLSQHERMRGYRLGVGRGIERACQAIAHVTNAAQIRAMREPST